MTEWDHGHDEHEPRDAGPAHDPAIEPGWDGFGAGPAHPDEPATPDDPYGSAPEPGSDPHHPYPPADEPAGLPEEQPADWSGAGGSWDQDLHDGVETDQADLSGGTDPAAWTAAADADPFPAALDVDVQPEDGGPWVDPDLLGGPDHWTADTAGPELVTPVDPPAALLPDLAAADGDPDAGWDALRDSDDPAVRALAQHWNP
jgi:hypothetical protein